MTFLLARLRIGGFKSRLVVSIRSKIFVGCMSLAFVTILTGVLAQSEQVQLRETALGIYDNAFISMNYLRSAQVVVLGVSRDLALGDKTSAVFVDQLQSAFDTLDVARERAMSPRGRDQLIRLQSAVVDLQSTLKTAGPGSQQKIVDVEEMIDMAVQVYASDGFRLRRSVEALVYSTQLQTYGAILASIVAAFVITLMLSRAIVPSIRHAVKIATAIAEGQLDNQVDRQGTGETGILLNALGSLQDNIAEKIVCIETLMAQEASAHAAEIALQHARFEAALDNMTLGLCMFDADNGLLVRNRRFVEMFPDGIMGSDDAALPPDLQSSVPALTAGQPKSGSFSCLLDDGRTIAVSEEPMEGGGRVVTYEDITERKRVEARLSHMARHDALTGLPNRVMFREQLERGMTHVRRGGVLTVMCVDLDRFKTVNDTLGHPVGDALLREAAQRLLQSARSADLVVRLGGDEFAIVQCSSKPAEESKCLAECLIRVLSLPFEIDGHRISIGASIGIAETIVSTDTPDSLLKNADLALYLAKEDGRGTYRFFEREMDERLQAKRRLELDLRTALAERQFELFYQPLVNTRTCAVVAFEALLRWHHPCRGIVSPADFIPLAEETGLIGAIGLWVLNQACDDAARWPAEIKVAVNLSPLQFRFSNLVKEVTDALQRSGLPPLRLELEITESFLLQEVDSTLKMLHNLRALGICISMDDFGTGYSSLSYLRRFPFDKIKIDRSFVQNIYEDRDGLTIVKAVIALGQSLRMNVVAEGVETDDQMDLLCRAGCEEVQGYLIGRPQPLAATKDFIGRFDGRAVNALPHGSVC